MSSSPTDKEVLAKTHEQPTSLTPIRRLPNGNIWIRNADVHKTWSSGRGMAESLTTTPLHWLCTKSSVERATFPHVAWQQSLCNCQWSKKTHIEFCHGARILTWHSWKYVHSHSDQRRHFKFSSILTTRYEPRISVWCSWYL